MWKPREPEVLGHADQPVVFEHLARDQRDVEDLAPVDPGHRVEVDAQFVGVVEIVGPHRVRVEIDAAEVDRPDQPRRVVQNGFLGRGARRVLELGDVDEVRPLLRGPFLEDRLLLDALDEAFEDHRAVPRRRAARRRPPRGSSGSGRAW